jgi:circadian clock protein KaiC
MTKQTDTKGTNASPSIEGALSKMATDIAGLDEILEGGLPKGRTTLVSGGPGTGKTVLGLEFLYRGAVAGEPGILVAFEERADAVRQNAASLGWDLAPLEQAGQLFLMEARLDPQVVLSGSFDLQGLLAIIGGQATTMGARRIVIDALDVLLRIFDDPARERNQIYALHDWLMDRQMTAILTVKTSPGGEAAPRYEFLDFMADCVIYLDQRVTGQVSTRRLRVIKYRGSGFGRNEYPYVITGEGISLLPISTAGLGHEPLGPKVSSGHPRLDSIMDGGYRRASCALIAGTSGTGKTTLACTFARAACERGEKVLYINFEESEGAMVSAMLSPAIDLRPALQAGTLQVMTAMPEAMGAEEHLVRAFKALEVFQPQHVVVDAISSCKRMGTEQVAFEYVVRLVNACKERGITCILINQAAGFKEEQEISGIGISSLVDTVIFLRYIDVGGEINRMLLVMKSRGSKHSNQYREFLITDQGIDVADVYVGEGGVLTGVARQEQEAREAAERQRRQQMLQQKEAQITRRRAALEAQVAAMQAEIEAAEAELEALQLEEEVAQRSREVRAEMRGEDADSDRPQTDSVQDKGGAA